MVKDQAYRELAESVNVAVDRQQRQRRRTTILFVVLTLAAIGLGVAALLFGAGEQGAIDERIASVARATAAQEVEQIAPTLNKLEQVVDEKLPRVEEVFSTLTDQQETINALRNEQGAIDERIDQRLTAAQANLDQRINTSLEGVVTQDEVNGFLSDLATKDEMKSVVAAQKESLENLNARVGQQSAQLELVSGQQQELAATSFELKKAMQTVAPKLDQLESIAEHHDSLAASLSSTNQELESIRTQLKKQPPIIGSKELDARLTKLERSHEAIVQQQQQLNTSLIRLQKDVAASGDLKQYQQLQDQLKTMEKRLKALESADLKLKLQAPDRQIVR